MRKSGLTSATVQHLQRLARHSSGIVNENISETPEVEAPPLIDRRADRKVYAGTPLDEEDPSKELSDKELILTVIEGEGAPLEEGAEEVAEEAVAEGLDFEAEPLTPNREDDPMLKDLEEEPWDDEWKVR